MVRHGRTRTGLRNVFHQALALGLTGFQNLRTFYSNLTPRLAPRRPYTTQAFSVCTVGESRNPKRSGNNKRAPPDGTSSVVQGKRLLMPQFMTGIKPGFLTARRCACRAVYPRYFWTPLVPSAQMQGRRCTSIGQRGPPRRR